MNFDLNDFSREYLEKIIQIPFYIPPIDGKSTKKYVNSILESRKIHNKRIEPKEDIFQKFKKDLKDDFISELIITTDINPRRIKRILNLTFLNYVFMKFKNIEKNNLKINTKLLAFLCIIREVYPSFYKEMISRELSCRNTFKSFFERHDEEKKAYEMFDKEEFVVSGDSDNEKYRDEALDENNINTNEDSNKNLYEKIYPIFELYFKERNISNVNQLNEELYYVSLYINVSNLNVSENDGESEWGKLAQIKSDITGKKLIIFLNMLSENSPAKNLVYWFFSDIYFKRKDRYILGIVKNVNIYRKIEEGREWVFKFDFNKKNNTLDIIFQWRNEYKTIVENLDEVINSSKYNSISKKIEVDAETTPNELDKIKEDLINIIDSLNFSERELNYNTSKEVAATNNSIE